MSIHILCLNVLLLTATCYPTAIPQIMLPYLARYAGKRGNAIYLCMCNILYVILCVISLMVLPKRLPVLLPASALWYLAAVITGAVVIYLEYLIGKGIMMLQGKKVKGFAVNSSWQNASAFVTGSTIVLAVLEEWNFRLVWNETLVEQIGLPVCIFVLLSGVFYAMNHLYFGIETFLQKLITGFILALLYVFSGEVILIPVLAHVLQNVLIIIMGRSRKIE
ncbi:CPBP family glutamic-type intramembrane protease [[Clostridium] polysaccharolyticum]|uniref:CAAX protease self-immunity n=1 Tax=[Clostridium] polysaccharolyticum TaxID=29364 RepID=A0A1H9Z8T2_9FIRM|nr:CPBP family intramembrane glutamic endopeptidase [[Clostridium] polysaccharolyticum]SES77477.1 CAAX protease self-immunity [[Clostridium] polysaccharolyticum]